MRSLRYTPRSIQRAYSVHVAPPSSASNEKSQTGSSAVACVSPVARWKITQNSPIAGLYKCTHTHTHTHARMAYACRTAIVLRPTNVYGIKHKLYCLQLWDNCLRLWDYYSQEFSLLVVLQQYAILPHTHTHPQINILSPPFRYTFNQTLILLLTSSLL